MKDLLEKAVAKAAVMHHGQLYGEKMYVSHLADVVYNLHRFGFLQMRLDDDLFNALEIAGWLHDSVEDTPLTIEEVRDDFGDTVGPSGLQGRPRLLLGPEEGRPAAPEQGRLSQARGHQALGRAYLAEARPDGQEGQPRRMH